MRLAVMVLNNKRWLWWPSKKWSPSVYCLHQIMWVTIIRQSQSSKCFPLTGKYISKTLSSGRIKKCVFYLLHCMFYLVCGCQTKYTNREDTHGSLNKVFYVTHNCLKGQYHELMFCSFNPIFKDDLRKKKFGSEKKFTKMG
jgi:hypothetical protein